MLSYGSITVSNIEEGSQIWTTTTAPSSPNYTFTISRLTGDTNTSPKIGDIIMYSYYRYTITSVGETTVLAGTRQSIRGAGGNSATNMLLGLESISIACDDGGATKTSATITIPFAGYVGANRSAITATVTDLPTGITVTDNTAGTTSADGSLELSIASGSTLGDVDHGVITVTLTCNSLSYVKKLAWSKSIDGTSGVSATSIICGNESQSIICSSDGLVDGVQTITIPFAGYVGMERAACSVTYSTLPSGITLGSNSAATDSADGSLVLNVANDGTLGGASVKSGIITLTFSCNSQTFVKKFSWAKAIAGVDGTSVSVTSVEYQAGTSSTTAPTGSWSSTVVDVAEGQYLWSKTTFSNGSVVYSVSKQGVSGDNFTWNLMKNTLNPDYQDSEGRPHLPGGMAVTILNSYSDQAATHGVQAMNDEVNRTFIRFGTTNMDNASLYGLTAGQPYTLSFDCYYNLLGGVDSNNNDYNLYFYLYDNSANEAKFANVSYVAISRITPAKKGLDQYCRAEIPFTITDGATKFYIVIQTAVSTASHYKIGNYIRMENIMLQEGTKVSPWAPAYSDLMGNGISSITNYYLATSASSGVTTETTGWTTIIQTMTSTNCYLWNYEVTTYTNGEVDTSTPCIIGNYSSDGRGITSVVEYYKASSSNSTAPSSWETTVPTLDTTNRYLWNYEVINYTTGNPDETLKRVIGVYGDSGINATNVVVGNESISIPCGSDGKTKSASNIAIPFAGYEGTTRKACSVEASNLPTGISVNTSSSSSATTSADGSLVLSVANASNLGGNNSGTITLTFTCNELTFVRKFAWSKSIDGVDGVSATSIVCGNEAQSIICSSDGLVDGDQEIVIPFAGYEGTTRKACTVTYSSLPSGITLKTNGNIDATTSADGSLTFSVANGGTLGGTSIKTGVITLTFSCNSETFVKKFSWSKAIAGSDGTSVSVSSVEYQAGTSSTTAPTGTWSDSVVDAPEGQYLWSKTTFSNGSVVYNVSKQGVSGDNFTWNLMANTLNPGYTSTADRPHIIGQTVDTYAAGSGENNATHGIQSLVTGATAARIRFGSDSASTATLNGLAPGKTYTLSFDCYWNLYKNGASTTRALYIYLYDDSETAGSLAASQSLKIADLPAASKGIDGSKRVEFTFTVGGEVTMLYIIVRGNNTSTSLYQAGNYVRMENIMLEEGSVASPWSPAYIDLIGNGIQSITNYYLATSESSGVTTSTSGWTTTIQSVTSTNKYLWNYETVTYTDGSTHDTNPAIIGTYGNTGKGISSIVEYYQVSDSNSTPPSTWLTTVPSLSPTDKYLWNYETINYTEGQPVNTEERVIGVYGDPGDDAITMKITSSDGTIFKNTSIATTLTSDLYKGGVELTTSEISALGTISWYKDGSATAAGTGKTLVITSGTVNQKATYEARLAASGSTIAMDSITLATIRDVAATYIFYQLSSSTPAQPTVKAIPPTGWSTTEPEYTNGETRDLYTVELTVFTDDTFNYSDVSKSIQYKAAQAAYSHSVSAITAANAAEAKANKLMIDSEIIVGTQTAATAVWKGNASFDSLVDGQQIVYWLPYNGSSTKATLNLTLADGVTKTGAIPCYYQGTTRITTHYKAGSILHLTYMVNAKVGSDETRYTGWWADANYTVTNTNDYDRIQYKASVTAVGAIPVGTLGVFDSDGLLMQLSTTAFDVTKPILYVGTAYTASALTQTNNYIGWGTAFSLATTVPDFSGTAGAAVYIMGMLDGNMFTPSDEVLTTTVPIEEDGYTYMLLGLMSTTVNAVLAPEHPMYRYYNGKFQTISQLAYEAYIALDDTREDLQEQITTTADAVASNASAINNIQITQTTFEADLDGITGRVEGLETSVSGLDTRISTEMQQLADQFNFTFNTQSEVENIQKYIRFIDGKIYIGETSSELTLQISNDRISFMSGSDEVAYISNKRLYINDAVFLESITIGNFAFVPRSNGNLSFKKIT